MGWSTAAPVRRRGVRDRVIALPAAGSAIAASIAWSGGRDSRGVPMQVLDGAAHVEAPLPAGGGDPMESSPMGEGGWHRAASSTTWGAMRTFVVGGSSGVRRRGLCDTVFQAGSAVVEPVLRPIPFRTHRRVLLLRPFSYSSMKRALTCEKRPGGMKP